MLSNSLYKQLEQVVGDNNYTVEQVETLTRSQVIALLGTDEFTQTFLANVKNTLVRCIQEKTDEATAQSVKSILLASFPNLEVEQGKETDKPFVKLWLEGKAETEEVI